MTNKSIFVTQPKLPPLSEFIPYLEEIWDSKQLSNNGPMHQKLEQYLCEYLNVEYISLFNNGTNALITALQALNITGEVITTPYSFVATANSIVWNGLKPVFVDIDPDTLNLDPSKIEQAITPDTTAIMPVHCYGNPCNTSEIKKLADKYDLRVIYDAAHAFAVEDSEGSILRHGDLSILSFHATKVFNTFEGGAIVCNDQSTKEYIDKLKNFGFVNETTVELAGINGKMSEINAAFGLLQLNYIDEAISQRKVIDQFYRQHLKDVQGVGLIAQPDQVVNNFSYFPILINDDYPITRDELYMKLKNHNIFARRYFYPLISEFQMYCNLPSSCPKNLPVASNTAKQVICLPIYADITIKEAEFIINLIR